MRTDQKTCMLQRPIQEVIFLNEASPPLMQWTENSEIQLESVILDVFDSLSTSKAKLYK